MDASLIYSDVNLEPYEIKSLVESIRLYGVRNPLTVRKNRDKYQVIHGHARYLACVILQLDVPVCVIDVTDEIFDELQVHNTNQNLRKQDGYDTTV